jgi:hypothetical protein
MQLTIVSAIDDRVFSIEVWGARACMLRVLASRAALQARISTRSQPEPTARPAPRMAPPPQIDAGESVDTLKAILEADSGIPASQQQLLHGNAPLPPGQPLSAAGVADGAMLMLLPAGGGGGGGGAARGGQAQAQGQGQAQQQAGQQRADPSTELNPDGTAKAPAAFIQTIKGNAAQMAALAQTAPGLAKAIRDENVVALQVGRRRRACVRGGKGRRRWGAGAAAVGLWWGGGWRR